MTDHSTAQGRQQSAGSRYLAAVTEAKQNYRQAMQDARLKFLSELDQVIEAAEGDDGRLEALDAARTRAEHDVATVVKHSGNIKNVELRAVIPRVRRQRGLGSVYQTDQGWTLALRLKGIRYRARAPEGSTKEQAEAMLPRFVADCKKGIVPGKPVLVQEPVAE